MRFSGTLVGEAAHDSNVEYTGAAIELENSVTLADDDLLDLLCPGSEEADRELNRLRFTLPPPEMRAEGFRNRDEILHNRIPTPLDSRGLVDVDALIRQVKATIKPGYRWPGYSDRHHTLWPAYRYGMYETFKPGTEAISFRNLAVNKIWVSRVFHNWIHLVTLPPDVPSEAAMRESIDEWVVMRDFFASIKDTTRIMRIYERERERRKSAENPLTDDQEELLGVDMRRRLGGVIMHFRNLEGIELGRWPISRDMGLHEAAGQIGDLVLRGWQRRTKDVRRMPEELPVAA